MSKRLAEALAKAARRNDWAPDMKVKGLRRRKHVNIFLQSKLDDESGERMFYELDLIFGDDHPGSLLKVPLLHDELGDVGQLSFLQKLSLPIHAYFLIRLHREVDMIFCWAVAHSAAYTANAEQAGRTVNFTIQIGEIAFKGSAPTEKVKRYLIL